MVRVVLQSSEGDSPGFVHHQVGRGGPFKFLFQRVVKPALQYLGKKAVKTGFNVAGDVMEGSNLKESLGNRFKQSKGEIVNDMRKEVLGYGRRPRGSLKRKRRQKSIKIKAKQLRTSDIFS